MAMQEATLKKNRLIVDEWFINGFNGSKAWQKYHPKTKDSTAANSFARMIINDDIEKYIAEKQKDAERLASISHNRILEELINWAYSDITEVLLLPIEQLKTLPPEVRRLITEADITTTETILEDETTIKTTKAKLWFVSKEKAIEMISKHTGFFGEHNYQKNPSISASDRERRIAELKEKLLNKDGK